MIRNGVGWQAEDVADALAGAHPAERSPAHRRKAYDAEEVFASCGQGPGLGHQAAARQEMAAVQVSPPQRGWLGSALLNDKARRDLPDPHRTYDDLRGGPAVRLGVNVRGNRR